MAWDSPIEIGVIRPAILDDDLSFFELLLVRPDLVSDDVVFFADGRSWGGTTEGWPLAVGWRRGAGPVILGAATGTATDALLIGVLHLAGATAGWDLAEWNERVRAWWEDAPPEVRDKVDERWELKSGAPREVAAWTRSAWNEEPSLSRAAVGVVATRLPDSSRNAIAWLAAHDPAVAYAIRWYGADASPVPRLDLVGGSWTPPEASAPAPEESLPDVESVAGTVPTDMVADEPPVPEPAAEDHDGAASDGDAAMPAQPPDTNGIVAGIEAIAREAGATVSRSAEWVRIAGPRRSVRAFPSSDGVDIQLVGLDEGTMVGLRYRHGVELGLVSGPDAPPGVHLRVTGTALGPPVGELLRSWLGGEGEKKGAADEPATAGKAARGRSRRPRNPRRR